MLMTGLSESECRDGVWTRGAEKLDHLSSIETPKRSLPALTPRLTVRLHLSRSGTSVNKYPVLAPPGAILNYGLLRDYGTGNLHEYLKYPFLAAPTSPTFPGS